MPQARSPASIDDLARYLPDFCHRNGISRVEVFGSVARGEASPDSDLDLMITFLPGVEPGLDFFGMQDELKRMAGRRVDLFTRRSVERSENWIRRRSILESAREIYAA